MTRDHIRPHMHRAWRRNAILALLPVCVVLFVQTGRSAQSQGEPQSAQRPIFDAGDAITARQKRPVTLGAGRPLDEQVAALATTDEDTFEVFQLSAPPLAGTDESGSLLTTYLRTFDLVAVIRTTDVRGRLTEDRMWIDADISAEIVDVLKTSDRTKARYAKGGALVFAQPGGATEIHGKRVVARPVWIERLIEPNKEYLVFGTMLDGELFVGLGNAYEVFGPYLRQMFEGPKDEIALMRLEEVREKAVAFSGGRK